MKALIVFDLDGTLAPSKSAIDAEMGTLLDALLGVVKVAIISGGAFPQFDTQVLTLGLAFAVRRQATMGAHYGHPCD